MRTIATVLLTNQTHARVAPIEVTSLATTLSYVPLEDIELAGFDVQSLQPVQSLDFDSLKPVETPKIDGAKVTLRRFEHLALVKLPAFHGTTKWLAGDTTDDAQAARSETLALVPIDADSTDLPKGSTVIGFVPCEVYEVLCTEMNLRESFQVGFIVPETEAVDFARVAKKRRNMARTPSSSPREVPYSSFRTSTYDPDVAREIRRFGKGTTLPDGEVHFVFETEELYIQARDAEREVTAKRLEKAAAK